MTQSTDIEIISVTPNTYDDGLMSYEINLNVIHTYTYGFRNAAHKPHVFVNAWTITIWQFGAKLWAWKVRNENGTLFHGTNGADGERYQGFWATYAESMKSFSIYIQR